MSQTIVIPLEAIDEKIFVEEASRQLKEFYDMGLFITPAVKILITWETNDYLFSSKSGKNIKKAILAKSSEDNKDFIIETGILINNSFYSDRVINYDRIAEKSGVNIELIDLTKTI